MTMVDMEVPEKVTSLAETEGGKKLVIHAARIAELELQVQNLEQLVTKAREEKEESREELTVELKQKKSEVRVRNTRLDAVSGSLKR